MTQIFHKQQFFHKHKKSALETIADTFLKVSVIGALLYSFGLYYGFQIYEFIDSLSHIGFGKTLIKGSAVASLALYALFKAHSPKHILLVAALALSATGDIYLTFSYPNAFIYGLLAFMFGHIFLILLYVLMRSPRVDIAPFDISAATFFWIITAVSLVYAYPLLPTEMIVPVIAYSLVLTTMTSMALISRYPSLTVGLGAVLFLISDAVLGARQFMNAPEFTDYIIWTTYYLGQLLMTIGVITFKDVPKLRGGYRFD